MNRLAAYSYLNGNANKNVITGTMLRNAHEKVADVYSSPRRNKYCASVTLIYINFFH